MTEVEQVKVPMARRRRRRRRRRGGGTAAAAVPGVGPPEETAPAKVAAAPPAATAAAPTVPQDLGSRLRAGILAFLSRHPETQVGTLLDSVRQGLPYYDRTTEAAALEVLHELVTANVVMPGIDRNHLGWPWLRVTRYGRQVIRQGRPLPFDPDQYLAEAQPRLSGIPPLALEVLGEAVATYHRGFVRSSALLLGTASELLMVQLIDAFVASRPARDRQRLETKMADKSIYARYRLFREEFDAARGTLPLTDAVSKDIEAIIDLVFNAVRLTRNEAGHPSGAPLNPVLVATTLQAFLEYADRIAQLVAVLQAPPAAKLAPTVVKRARPRSRRRPRQASPA